MNAFNPSNFRGVQYRFEKEDKIFMRGVEYRFVRSNTQGVWLQRLDGDFPIEVFEHAAIGRMLAIGQLRVIRANRSLPAAKQPAEDEETLSNLTGRIRADLRNRHIVVLAFQALLAEGLIKRTEKSIEAKGLATALQIALRQAGAIVGAGLIRPSVAADPGRGLGAFAFSRRDVDAFISALLDGAEVVTEASPGFVTVDLAARAVGRPIATVLGAVLDGGLQDRQRVGAATGITGLRLRREDVAALFPLEPLVGYRLLTEAAEWLGVPYAAMPFLLRKRRGGALISTEDVSRQRRGRPRAIPEAALEAVDRRYVTPRKLARELGLSGISLSLQVDKLHVSPAFDPKEVKTRIYTREKLEAAITTLTLKPLKAGARRQSRSEVAT